MANDPKGAFKPALSTAEAKGDASTRAARAIVSQQTAERDAKTARLKAARLAKEAADNDAAPPPVEKKRKKPAA